MQQTSAQDQTVWEGSPSQWLNFKAFVLSGVVALAIGAALAAIPTALPQSLEGYKAVLLGVVAALLVFPLFVVLKSYLEIRTTRYTVTTERIRFSRGILSKRVDDTELYRVDDIFLDQPFLLRLVSRGNVVLTTSDRSTPTLTFQAVPDFTDLRDQIRRWVETCRAKKGTRVVDFEPQPN